MIDPSKMSEVERELLEEVARSKGHTLEEELVALGHAVTPAEDVAVSFEGTSQTAEPPIKEATPAFMDSDPLAVETAFPMDVKRLLNTQQGEKGHHRAA